MKKVFLCGLLLSLANCFCEHDVKIKIIGLNLEEYDGKVSGDVWDMVQSSGRMMVEGKLSNIFGIEKSEAKQIVDSVKADRTLRAIVYADMGCIMLVQERGIKMKKIGGGCGMQNIVYTTDTATMYMPENVYVEKMKRECWTLYECVMYTESGKLYCDGMWNRRIMDFIRKKSTFYDEVIDVWGNTWRVYNGFRDFVDCGDGDDVDIDVVKLASVLKGYSEHCMEGCEIWNAEYAAKWKEWKKEYESDVAFYKDVMKSRHGRQAMRIINYWNQWKDVYCGVRWKL